MNPDGSLKVVRGGMADNKLNHGLARVTALRENDVLGAGKVCSRTIDANNRIIDDLDLTNLDWWLRDWLCRI
jgi:hypothetical protein